VLSRAERATVRSADVVLAASGDLADNARRLGARDVRTAPVSAPSLPPARRTREEVRAELGLDGARPLVVAVGRLHPQKGYDVLFDALAGSDEPPLVAIAGDGPLHDDLAARIRAEQLPVVLLGRRDDVADLLAAADACVLPSVWEARSLTAQEALRSGTPLVATRTGGLPELLGNAAELVPVGDAAALWTALQRVLGDRAHAERLAEAGRRRASEWPDDQGTARSLAALYRELLGAPEDARP
jgi:glycosyltransferase involved in cell wall biosynthesis